MKISLQFVLEGPLENNPALNRPQAIIWTNAAPIHLETWKHLESMIGKLSS